MSAANIAIARHPDGVEVIGSPDNALASAEFIAQVHAGHARGARIRGGVLILGSGKYPKVRYRVADLDPAFGHHALTRLVEARPAVSR